MNTFGESLMTTPTCSGLRGARLLLVAGAAIAAVTLTACSTAAPAATEATETRSQQQQGERPSGMPEGVSGLIASAEDGQLQVQGSDSQTTVRYTEETTVRTNVEIAATDIKVGDCITAMTGEDDATTTITVTEAVDGGCGVGGFPGGGTPGGGDLPEGGFPEGERPEGVPTERPGGGEMPEDGFGGFTVGTVTAVEADVLTVDAVGQDGETTRSTVDVSTDTSITTTVDGSTADIVEGLCVTAQGEADDAGGYDATSLSLSQPDADGECNTLGGFRGGFAGPPSNDGDDS